MHAHTHTYTHTHTHTHTHTGFIQDFIVGGNSLRLKGHSVMKVCNLIGPEPGI